MKEKVTIRYMDGVYFGEVNKNGEPHGKGKVKESYGNWVKGIFENGEFIGHTIKEANKKLNNHENSR